MYSDDDYAHDVLPANVIELYRQPARDALDVHVRKIELEHRAGVCKAAEKKHSWTVSPMSAQYRNGAVFVVGGVPVGHVKFFGQKSFLSWIDSTHNGERVLVKGGLYSLPFSALDAARDTYPDARTWGVVELDELGVVPRRMSRDNTWLGLQRNIARERRLFEYGSNRFQIFLAPQA